MCWLFYLLLSHSVFFPHHHKSDRMPQNQIPTAKKNYGVFETIGNITKKIKSTNPRSKSKPLVRLKKSSYANEVSLPII